MPGRKYRDFYDPQEIRYTLSAQNAAEQGCLKIFFILQPQLLNQKAFRPFKKNGGLFQWRLDFE